MVYVKLFEMVCQTKFTMAERLSAIAWKWCLPEERVVSEGFAVGQFKSVPSRSVPSTSVHYWSVPSSSFQSNSVPNSWSRPAGSWMHCMHSCVHAFMRACIHACTYSCVHEFMRACIHACMHSTVDVWHSLHINCMLSLVSLMLIGHILWTIDYIYSIWRH